MNREKTAEFLADCLAQMPDQPEHVQRVVDTVIAGLTRIASGQAWPDGEALKAGWAATYWSAAAMAAWAAVRAAPSEAAWAADWAARAHPDPDAERARQAKVREKLGLNTKQEAK